MCDLTKFFKANPRSEKIASFQESDLQFLLEKNIPADIIEFLQTEGLATYRDNFFCTTMPQEHFQLFSEWGLKGENCYAFLKTAFGSLCFYKKGKIFQLNPITGSVYKGLFEFCGFMNLLAITDSFMESCYFDIYQEIKKNRVLKPDEIFALVPALPLGGSFKTSKFEVVKMREHLAFLAQLFGNKAKIK